MTVYLLHLNQPLPRGMQNGKPRFSGHYIGFTEDLVGRLLEHGETTWTRLDEPVVTEDGKKITGVKHGSGATFMGVVNARGITYQLARIWEEADQAFERRLKNYKKPKRFCPVCNPNAMNLMTLEEA